MIAKGNSEVGVCAHTLLSVMQREIPFSRSKGIDPDVYDIPFADAGTYLDETARAVLDYYEPRVDVDRIRFDYGQELDGNGIRYTVDLIDSGIDEDDEYGFDDDEGDDE